MRHATMEATCVHAQHANVWVHLFNDVRSIRADRLQSHYSAMAAPKIAAASTLPIVRDAMFRTAPDDLTLGSWYVLMLLISKYALSYVDGGPMT